MWAVERPCSRNGSTSTLAEPHPATSRPFNSTVAYLFVTKHPRNPILAVYNRPHSDLLCAKHHDAGPPHAWADPRDPRVCLWTPYLCSFPSSACLAVFFAPKHHDHCSWPSAHLPRRLVAMPDPIRATPGPSPASLAAVCHDVSLDHQAAPSRNQFALPFATLLFPDGCYGPSDFRPTSMAAERPT